MSLFNMKSSAQKTREDTQSFNQGKSHHGSEEKLALIKCPDCGKRISRFAETCPACGCPKWRIDSCIPAIIRTPFVRQGELYVFGRYHGIPLQWRVLHVSSSRVLLITEKVLDEYFDVSSATKWKYCTLRRWLNEVFYFEAFDDMEREAICLTRIEPFNWSSFKREDASEDYVFCLSDGEAEDLFRDDADRIAEPLEVPGWYDLEEDWDDDSETDVEGSASRERIRSMGWWLSSTGKKQQNLANFCCVLHDGSIDMDGRCLDYGNLMGVRPAMWLSV